MIETSVIVILQQAMTNQRTRPFSLAGSLASGWNFRRTIVVAFLLLMRVTQTGQRSLIYSKTLNIEWLKIHIIPSFHSLTYRPSQEIGWFDRIENQPGVLTSRLATEASMVRTVSGFQLAMLLEGLVLIVSAFVIGFVDCWQVTLLLMAFVPFILIGGYLEVSHRLS